MDEVKAHEALSVERLTPDAERPIVETLIPGVEWAPLRERHDEIGATLAHYPRQTFDLVDAYPTANEYIEAIEAASQRCLGALRDLLTTMEHGGYKLDFLVWGLGKRVVDLGYGYLRLMPTLNMNVAAALPRLQLDSFLRLNIVRKVGPDDQTVIDALLGGRQLDKVIDPTWKPPRKKKGPTPKPRRLTDGCLRRHASDFDWVDTIYKESSKWVHQSNRSHGTAWRFVDESNFVGSINNRPDMYPESFILDVTWAMLQVTYAATDLVQYFVAGALQKPGSNNQHLFGG